MVRVWISVLLCASLPLMAAQTAPPAGDLLASAEKAVRGAAAPIRTLDITGRCRILIGSTGKLSDPRPLTIRILPPDHYRRTVTNDASESVYGFAGSTLLNALRALRPGDSFGASYGPEQVGIERAWLARFMLGTTAARLQPVRAVRTLSTTSVEAAGDDGFLAQVDLDPETRLPLRVRHVGDVRFPLPGSTAPPAPEKAEIVWAFEQRRPVNGAQLPHRVVRSARGVTLEEMELERIQINSGLSAKDFQK